MVVVVVVKRSRGRGNITKQLCFFRNYFTTVFARAVR